MWLTTHPPTCRVPVSRRPHILRRVRALAVTASKEFARLVEIMARLRGDTPAAEQGDADEEARAPQSGEEEKDTAEGGPA